MKKIIALVVTALVSASAVFAGNFEHSLGIGATFPISSVSFDEDYIDDASQTGVGFDLTYLAIHNNNNITFKMDFAYSAISSDDVVSDPDATHDIMFDLGLGYTFLKNERFTLSALGMLGMSLSGYDWTYKYSYLGQPCTVDALAAWMTFDIGADLVGKVKFTDHFGMFANLGFRYGIGVWDRYYAEGKINGKKVVDIDENLNIAGAFKFIPTIGVSWTF